MKFSLVSIAAVASCASLASAFMVQPPSPVSVASRTSVVLQASRKQQKIASRTKWAASRGLDDSVTASSEKSSLLKNDDGLEYVRLVSESGASAEIYLLGGVVTSFKDAEGTEFIAVRPDAKMDGSKPISGGLSHCWPQVRIIMDVVLCCVIQQVDLCRRSYYPASYFWGIVSSNCVCVFSSFFKFFSSFLSSDLVRFNNTDLPAMSSGTLYRRPALLSNSKCCHPITPRKYGTRNSLADSPLNWATMNSRPTCP